MEEEEGEEEEEEERNWETSTGNYYGTWYPPPVSKSSCPPAPSVTPTHFGAAIPRVEYVIPDLISFELNFSPRCCTCKIS